MAYDLKKRAIALEQLYEASKLLGMASSTLQKVALEPQDEMGGVLISNLATMSLNIYTQLVR